MARSVLTNCETSGGTEVLTRCSLQSVSSVLYCTLGLAPADFGRSFIGKLADGRIEFVSAVGGTVTAATVRCARCVTAVEDRLAPCTLQRRWTTEVLIFSSRVTNTNPVRFLESTHQEVQAGCT